MSTVPEPQDTVPAVPKPRRRRTVRFPRPGRPRLTIAPGTPAARTKLAETIQLHLPPDQTQKRIGGGSHCDGATVSRVARAQQVPNWNTLKGIITYLEKCHVERLDAPPFPTEDDWYELYRAAVIESGRTPDDKDKPEDGDGTGGSRRPGGSPPAGNRPGSGRPVREDKQMAGLATLLWLPVTLGGTVAVLAALLAVFAEADWSWIVTAAAGFLAVYRLAVHKFEEYVKNLVRVYTRTFLSEETKESHESQEDLTDRPGRREG